MFVRIPWSVIASYNVGVNRAANHQNPARIYENVCKQFNDQIAGNVAAPRHPDLLFASQKPINTRSKLANDFVPFLLCPLPFGFIQLACLRAEYIREL